MKKFLICTLMTITAFTLVICDTNDDAITEISPVNSASTDTESTILETEIAPIESAEVETTDDKVVAEAEKNTFVLAPKQEIDVVSFDPHTVYYNESGELVVKGCVVNETDHNVGHIRFKKLEIYNDNDELIAKDSVGFIDYLTLKPGGQSEWTYTFPAMTVSIKDDDLKIVKAITKSSSMY